MEVIKNLLLSNNVEENVDIPQIANIVMDDLVCASTSNIENATNIFLHSATERATGQFFAIHRYEWIIIIAILRDSNKYQINITKIFNISGETYRTASSNAFHGIFGQLNEVNDVTHLYSAKKSENILYVYKLFLHFSTFF